MPKSHKPRKPPRRRRVNDSPRRLEFVMEVIAKDDLTATLEADDYRRFTQPKWQTLDADNSGTCDHTTTGCPDCITTWAKTHWIRVRPSNMPAATAWVSLNGAPGMPDLSDAYRLANG